MSQCKLKFSSHLLGGLMVTLQARSKYIVICLYSSRDKCVHADGDLEADTLVAMH